MKLLLIVFALAFQLNSNAQDLSTKAGTPAETAKDKETINAVLESSGRAFKDALIALTEGNKSVSGDKFDKAVESFLYSGLNIREHPKLQRCYSPLIEAIFRTESPDELRLPNFHELSTACSWKWADADFKVAERIIQILKANSRHDESPSTPPVTHSTTEQTGFNSQEFEPSPLDDLAMLDLGPVAPETAGTIDYTRPGPANQSEKLGIKVVRAIDGDTVTRLARRYGASPLEVAKFNGLLPNSMLASGREIKIPFTDLVRSKPLYPLSPTTLCSASIAPDLRSLRLGMHPSDLARIIGKSFTPKSVESVFYVEKIGDQYRRTLNRFEWEKRSMRLGETHTFISARQLSGKPNFDGTESLYFRFFDNTVYMLSIIYMTDGIEWSDARDFVSSVTGKLGLPLAAWRIGPHVGTISCDGFSVTAIVNGNRSSLQLGDTDIALKIESQAAKAFLKRENERKSVELRKKKAFKP
jgi:hypothetical protein